MVRETVNIIAKNYSKDAGVGVLATDGTILSGVYKVELEKLGLSIINLNKVDQEKLMTLIYGPKGIKAGNVESGTNRKIVINLAKKLQGQGAQVVVLGCTELSLLGVRGKNIIDPVDVLAELVCREYY